MPFKPTESLLELCTYNIRGFKSKLEIRFIINISYTIVVFWFPVPILAASDLTQALTLIIATFGFYSDFFITFDRSNWRRIIRDVIDGTHPKVL